MLETLGLDTASEAVYRSILSRPAQGVAELCAESGLGEDEVRAALDRLATMHLLRRTGDAAGELRVVDPAASLGALLARRTSELAQQQHRLEDARAFVAALAAEFQHDRDVAPGIVERIDDLDEVRSRMTVMVEEIREELLAFVPWSRSAEALSHARPLDQALLERGVSMRSVHLEADRFDPVTSEYCDWEVSLGAESRTMPTLPIQMIIMDREKALLPLDPEYTSGYGAYLLHSKGLVMTMVAFFEAVWRQARPWRSEAPVDAGGLNAVEREVLSLLAEGCTDDQVARRLQMSPRTVRRITADLMTRLQARSRFEAGLRAARAGWL